MICKPDQAVWTKEEQSLFLKSLNEQFPEKIKFEHDGIFETVVVIKSKNYALRPEGSKKIKIKGSGIKDQKKEPALKEMMNKVIEHLMEDYTQESLSQIYHEYVKEAMSPTNITRWCQKKSISESILNCRDYTEADIGDEEDEDSPRKNEFDVWNAVKSEEGIQQGDKIYVYPYYIGKVKVIKDKRKRNKESGLMETIGQHETEIDKYGLKLVKYYNNDIAIEKLLKRVYDTLKIFEKVIDIKKFPKYHLKSNKDLLLTLK
jgi:hypothetical protein